VSPPPSRILRVAELDLTYAPRPWPFAEERASDIRAHWLKVQAAQPSLFNGRVLLMGAHEFVSRPDGATILRGRYFDTEYKAFLAWRDFGFPDPAVRNGFAMAALQASDGAYLLGEMGSHTANAGAIYFAAGTPDKSDVFGNRVDLRASVLRELEEETGLAPSDVEVAEDWIVVVAPPRIACLKPVRADEKADALKARIEAYLARDAKPELARMHVVRSSPDLNEKRMPRFIVDFLRSTFGTEPAMRGENS
jgi:8-oxo-dGTP pyrophosphatase MutT (NUDIX family)